MIPVTAVTAHVPAKVNLHLAVGPVRDDGYHELVTVFHAVALFDEVTVAPADGDSVAVTGEGVFDTLRAVAKMVLKTLS